MMTKRKPINKYFFQKNGVFKVSGYFTLIWLDEFIVWEPDKKDGVTSFYVHQSDVWKPDLVHINSFKSSTELGHQSSWVVVRYNGTVSWRPQENLESSCKIDPTYFPNDEQICSIKVYFTPLTDFLCCSCYWTLLYEPL